MVFPKFGVLEMSTADNIGAANRLVGDRKVCIKRLANVVAGDKDASRFVAGCHYAEPASFKIERTRKHHTRKWVDGDHHRSLKPLPTLGRCDANL